MDITLYLSVLVWLCVWGLTMAGKCTYTREFRMLNADCYNQDLREIPTNLNRDIEVLFAANNRIRKLTNDSVQAYTSLKMLYLPDNFITKIEPGAFSETEDLEVLDLSRNAIRRFPEVLPLPLRTLYLSENPDLEFLSLSAAFNLAILHLAGCELKKIPAVGVLPNLKDLNITYNPLDNVTAADLAPFCRLKTLRLPPTLYQQSDTKTRCECHRLLTWTSQHYIQLPSFNCTPLVDPDIEGCEVNFTKEASVYEACMAAKPPPTTASYLLMLAVAASLLAAATVIVCWWRKGRRKKNSVEDQKNLKRKTENKKRKAVDTLIV